ncbi:unnamed protein product [Blepharisma stoltei]|uniref:GTPase Der n=1 Tax=Blepharisma stoltei TaxID=1481888 RepID=A0AAU9JDQ4_9CILI|nr:unnamed protein product [Blepharisma stoltei]
MLRFFRSFSTKNFLYTVSLVGRPNSGKSTLFNHLIGGSTSLVHNTPGLTRDRIEGITNLFGVDIKFIDTAGWDPTDTPNPKPIIEKMKLQTLNAIKLSDTILFLTDVRAGISPSDIELAQYLRKTVLSDKNATKDVILIGNKAESSWLGDVSNEVYKLGFGEPLLISAQHGEGIADLYEELKSRIPEGYADDFKERLKKRKEKHNKIKAERLAELEDLEKESGEDFNLKEWERAYDKLNPWDNSDYDSDNEIDINKSLASDFNLKDKDSLMENMKKHKMIQLAIIGRPNVGKSTLINAFLNEERVITDNQPGTTRDALYLDHVHKGKKICLVDTAGLTKHSRGTVNKLIQEDVMKAIKFSHAVVLQIEAPVGLTPVDLELAKKVIDEGRILLIVGNKWDLVPKDMKGKVAKDVAINLHTKITLKGLNVIFISALQNYNVSKIMDEIQSLYEKWNKRVSTGLLNRWLEAFKKVQPLPTSQGALLRIKYMMQIKARPPSFYVYVNDRSLMKENYLKNFTSSLTKEFGFEGVPVRILLRDKHLKAAKRHKPEFQVKKELKKQVGASYTGKILNSDPSQQPILTT